MEALKEKPQKKTLSASGLKKNNTVHIGELSIVKGISLEMKYSRSDSNGVPFLSLTPHYENNFENRFSTKKPGVTKGPKLKLLKKEIIVTNIEQLAISLYKHLYGKNTTDTLTLQSGSDHLYIKKHVAYKEGKVSAVFHSILGYNSSLNCAVNANLNKLTLRKLSSMISSICGINSVFPIRAFVGEGPKGKESPATLMINSENIRILVADEKIGNFTMNPSTKEVLLFAAEMYTTKAEVNPLNSEYKILIKGHTIEGNKISFYEKGTLIKLTISKELCHILLDSMSF